MGWSRASPSGESSPPPPMDMSRVGSSARDGGGAAGARRPLGSPAASRGPESGCHPHVDRRKDKRKDRRKDRRRAGVALHGRVCCLWTAGSREPEPRPCHATKTSRRVGPGLPVGASAARRERRAGWGSPPRVTLDGPRPVSEVTHRSGNAPAGPAPRTRVAPLLKEGAGCLPSPAKVWNSNGDRPRPTQTRGGAGPGGRGCAATRSPANPPLLLTPGVADEGRVARGPGAPEATPRSRSHRVGWPGHPHCGPPRPGIARSHAPGPGDPAARAGASRTRGSLPGAECHFYADRCATSAMA